MNLERELLRCYERCEESGLVDRCENIDSETVLLPSYHTNRRSDGKNILELVFDNKGCLDFNLSGYVAKDDYIIYPVTEASIVRSRNSSAHPLVEEVQYIMAKEGDKKEGLYLDLLLSWLDFEKDDIVRAFLKMVYNFATKDDAIDNIARILSSGSRYELDRDKFSIKIYSDDEKSKEITFDKLLLTFKVLSLDNGKDMIVTRSKRLHDAYISYMEYICSSKEKSVCNLTGKDMYCTDKHRGMFGTAKIISVSNHLEVYMGRFDKDGKDIISVGYETSQKLHNMLKYLLENSNTSKWLGGSVYLFTWFLDDISNDEEIDVTVPEKIDDFYDLDDDGFEVGGHITKKILSSVDTKDSFDHDVSAYILILDKVSNGRIAINYFQALPKSDFGTYIKHWKKTFNWYFWDDSKKSYILKTPDNYKVINYLFGTERDGKMEFSSSQDGFKTNLLIKLVSFIVEGKSISLDFYKKACLNIRTRNKYKKSWNSVMAISCAVINKHYSDIGRERFGDEMIDSHGQSRDYIYGRMLYLFEYIEKQAMDDNDRATNAMKFWNAYVQYPKKTLLNLKTKVQSYKLRLMKSENAWKLARMEKEFAECLGLLEALGEVDLKDRALNEEFIFGYYAEQKKMFAKKENVIEDK